MGDVGVLVINTIVALITVLSVILGFASYKTYKMKESLNEDEGVIRYILLLEEAMKKLNSALRSHDTRLNNQLHELSDIKDRLDILEADHHDTNIDYGAVDDDGNITEVWFKGKRYVPEDKPDEDVTAFYADGRVVAEITRPDVKCCATCQHYRPDSGYSTCDLRTWLHVTKAYAKNTHSVCNNYEKTSAVLVPSDKDKAEYIRFDKKVDDLQLKIDYITLCQEQDKLRNKEIGFNKQLESALQSGIMSVREWREFMEDLDSDT